MALDWLTDPVAEDAPCGPDLELAEDDAFLDYYYDAEGRLPERFATPGPQVSASERAADRLFDPTTVDLKAETAAIDALLGRSRDLRLLSLRARWAALARDHRALADAVDGMAALVGAHPDAVHPALPDRARDRRAAIEALCVPATLLQPLHHLPLSGDPETTWRRWQVAQGRIEGRGEETEASAAAILGSLSDKTNAPEVADVHASLSRCLAAVRALGLPTLAPLSDLLEGILELIVTARPDLAPTEEEEAAPEAETETQGDMAEDADAPAAAPVSAEDATSRAQAQAALAAVETYLAAREPSSAALLLVIQARQLIGRPLVEAIETLLPEDAPRAAIDFGPATGFRLPMDRLKALSTAIAAPVDDGPAPTPPNVTTRAEAAAQLRAAETWFRRNEPASPIPLLLDRARGWLEKDFEAILSDLLPPSPDG